MSFVQYKTKSFLLYLNLSLEFSFYETYGIKQSEYIDYI